MATTLDPNDRAIVNYDEPPVKPPPVLAVGPLAWMRENLFKSAFDTIVTIVTGVALVAAVIGFLQWAVGAANWFVVTSNLRLFMAGTFPAESLWRLEWAARLCTFLIGFTLMAYMRVNRVLVAILLILVILLFIVPMLVDATVQPVDSFLAAGETPIVSGTVTEAPQPALAFIARAGETVTVSLAGEDDDDLTALGGFTDRATAALITAAINRHAAQQELLDMRYQLERGLLTDAQRAELTETLNTTEAPPLISETYNLNQTEVSVRILDAAGAALGSATLTAAAPPLSVTVPEDGWYVLEKTVEGESAALLDATGIYPLRVRNLTRALPNGGSRQVEQYVRMTDSFESEAARPVIDDEEVPLMFITDNQYQGARSVGDFLKLFVAPFFRDLSLPILQLVLFGFAGYWSAAGLTRAMPPARAARGDRRAPVRGIVSWLWILFLIVLFLLAYGIPRLDALGAGVLISRFVWVGWMYFTGMNLDKAWGRPLLGLVTLLGIAQTVIAERLLDNLTIAGIVGVVIWLLIGLQAARMGRTARDRWNASLRTRALVVSALLWLVLFIAPPLLIQAAGANSENLLPVTDTRRWGGFMLTALLTIVAILASFPLGVLLALGRRSNLPVVKGACIVYIELVRGVPLITVLFMAQLLVPLVNPSLAEVDNVFRAMVGLTLFSAAYLAENVRGGLQSIPHGQEEAAKALGLSSWQVTLFITLPQALRAVIPALVGQAIALFKDTSLVALVGLVDLLGQSNSVIAQPEYIGLRREVYLFIGIIYFIFSYLMAFVSRRVEASGSGAARRV